MTRDDLTARARILEAAIEHFGEQGFDRATIRGIAQLASVSSGLLRHHFGSKQELREACDQRVTALIQKMNVDAEEFMRVGSFTPTHVPASYGIYLTRALTDGHATTIFDDIAAIAERWAIATDRSLPHPPPTSAHDRAIVGTAQAMAISILHSHISRGLGIDIRTPEGEQRLRRILVDLYAYPAISPEEADRIRAALDAADAAAIADGEPVARQGDPT